MIIFKNGLFFLTLAAVLLPGAALAQTSSSNSAPIQKTRAAIDLPCVQAAVEKRDSALETSWDKLSAAVKSALGSRKNALKDAWGKADKKERRGAINKAWKDYQAAVKAGRNAFKTERRAAWSQYKKDGKACHATVEDSSLESVDNTL